jgi:uncharacterized protein
MPDMFTTRAAIHAVPSPCVAVCVMTPATALCAGCLRTIDEIAGWSRMDNDAKRAVWAQIASRKAQEPASQIPKIREFD